MIKEWSWRWLEDGSEEWYYYGDFFGVVPANVISVWYPDEEFRDGRWRKKEIKNEGP